MAILSAISSMTERLGFRHDPTPTASGRHFKGPWERRVPRDHPIDELELPATRARKLGWDADTSTSPLAQMERVATLSSSRCFKLAGDRDAMAAHSATWITGIEKRVSAGEVLTVGEYNALLYTVRQGITDPAQGREVLRKAWAGLTGRDAAPGDITERRLPLRLLALAGREDRVFHVAIFHQDNEHKQRLSAITDYVPTPKHALIGAGVAAALCVCPPLAVAAAGYALMHVAASTFETAIHDHIGHADADDKATFDKLGPSASAYFTRMGYGHGVHHATFKNYVSQFETVEAKAAMDARITKRYGESYRKVIEELTLYGAIVARKNIPAYIWPLLPLFGAGAFVSGLSVPFMLGMVPAIASFPWQSSKVHDYYHMKKDKALAECSPLMKLYLSTPFARATSRAHWDHHRGSFENFNLIPGAVGDIVLGTYVPLSVAKLLTVRRLEVIGS